MLERLSFLPWFYLVLGLAIPFLATLGVFPVLGFSSLILALYTSIHAVLFLVIFLLLEQVLSGSIQKNRLRKATVFCLLFLTPYAEILFQKDPSLGLNTPLVLIFLLGFLIIIRDYFFRERGSLVPGAICGFMLGFLEPTLIPLIILITGFAAKKDRENAYLLFSGFMIPLIFWRIHSFQAEESLLVFKMNLQGFAQALQDSAKFTSDPVLFFLFLSLMATHLILASDPGSWVRALSLSTLIFFPIFSATTKFPSPSEGPLCTLAALIVAIRILPRFRTYLASLCLWPRVLVCVGLFYCLLPFYERGIGTRVFSPPSSFVLIEAPQRDPG
jgi:hypothetical protein